MAGGLGRAAAEAVTPSFMALPLASAIGRYPLLQVDA
jgi:hypothetical protein